MIVDLTAEEVQFLLSCILGFTLQCGEPEYDEKRVQDSVVEKLEKAD